MRNILNSEEVEKMDLTFSTSYDNFGMEKTVELKAGGVSIPVTQDTRREFVDLYLDWYFRESVENQFRPFFKGFYKVISQESIKVVLVDKLLNSIEVMKLICGVDNLDMKELESSTAYERCSRTDQTIVWFWEVINEFSDDEKRRFLKFTTGSDRGPLRGLAELKLIIMVQGLDDERLPSAHTCFNHLILPKYSTKEKLKEKMVKAIEHHEGFGLM